MAEALAPPGSRKKLWGKKSPIWVYVSLSISQIYNCVPLSRIKCERYIFYKVCFVSSIEVRVYVWLCSWLGLWDVYNSFCRRDRENYERHCTVRFQARLIFFECYSLILPQWNEYNIFGLSDLAWYFFNHLYAFSFGTTNIWVASKALRLSSSSKSISSGKKLRCTFTSPVFKSHIEWSNTERVSAPATTILLTTAVYLLLHEMLWSCGIRVAI